MTHDNVVLVRSLYEAFQRGDSETIAGAMSADAIWQVMGSPADYPTIGGWTGPAGVRDFLRLLAETQEAIEFNANEFIGGADHVVAIGHYEWKVRKTGNTLEAEWCHVFTLANGKVTHFREFTDTAAFADAFRA